MWVYCCLVYFGRHVGRDMSLCLLCWCRPLKRWIASHKKTVSPTVQAPSSDVPSLSTTFPPAIRHSHPVTFPSDQHPRPLLLPLPQLSQQLFQPGFITLSGTFPHSNIYSSHFSPVRPPIVVPSSSQPPFGRLPVTSHRTSILPMSRVGEAANQSQTHVFHSIPRYSLWDNFAFDRVDILKHIPRAS